MYAPGNRDETTRTHTRATVHLPKLAHSNLLDLHLEEDVVLAVEDLVIRPTNENKYVAI